MLHIIAGLGNPGQEYENTRHNTGRIVLDYFRAVHDFPEWEEEKKTKSLISKSKIKDEQILLLEPNNFMNNSGKSLAFFSLTKKQKEKTIVVYDDIDLPIGTIKIAFNRGSGGHNGIESVIKNLKTREFIRVRVGVSKVNSKGLTKKPKGEEAVLKFLLGKFTKEEVEVLKKVSKKVSNAIDMIMSSGQERAMGEYNR
jgi:PTH1 family peptidyl-tRNA hydrolase